ncbi:MULTISPECIES: TonB-system energizer ExbB [unclassified Ectothiorhodospira]|uniref:TonB-system energizer ExbB n=1 Tax=unclassified Ectothiorhodospira TaxID=2684909 RepID=UPI001EE839E8|nr:MULTISPECIES: TonB-system energizer ExbB [unclassified Ectothiorhodospira]MCG5515582.1 TonB-system energizer ExbB [Ectothiorhodospira sp. 9100]MCG5518741.1 TonB-system energizer ExbB [Ectothiorhodospira sp. 9905]
MDHIQFYLDITVFSILGLMSLFAFGFAIERWLYLRKVHLGRFDNEERLTVDLTRHLIVLSTVGANAPYVGLLGTVLGILITFYQIGQSGTMDTESIMLGLALALKATAGGIAVAIPSVVFFNTLMRRVEVLTLEWRGQRKEDGVHVAAV